MKLTGKQAGLAAKTFDPYFGRGWVRATNYEGDEDWFSPEGYDDSPDMGVHRFDGGGAIPWP